ncbi:PREDICTED: sperm-associated antigen 11-like isoform X1 [Ceratotherium simum simum]|uniref:Sperm-associated antigen 11-like isoform X1 n=1 Tax=Ceratotherium simum simum TaxID=73337 RepID=A0ABM0I5A0_CERSS|nr:PREDICTED: sperm-associated antigen 11-like isoform X1 [Ceratotherium simum simum]
MKRFLTPFILLLLALLFPGLSRARYINQQGTEGPREPKEESHGQGTNESHLLHHQVKRYLLPRTPPFEGDIPPGIRNIICLMQRGTCRLFFCHSGEKKGEICSDPWNRCCVPNAKEERKDKPEMDGESGT